LRVVIAEWVEEAHIEWLKPVSTVRWVSQYEDSITIAEVDEAHVEVATVAI
jgi:hypothetical protein